VPHSPNSSSANPNYRHLQELCGGEGLPRPSQRLAAQPERLVEVLFSGEDTTFGVPFPLVLAQRRDDPNHIYKAPGVAAGEAASSVSRYVRRKG
jgi:hypothetical protein